jgi:arginyl-tRNA synthetase
LGDVLEAIGRDAARFFLLLRPPDVPLGLDLTLAQARTQHNPLYRTQLALVRCCQALQQATAQGVPTPDPHAAVDLSLLTNPDERALIRKLADLPDEIGQAAAVGAPHRVVQYAMALADQFHDYCDRGDRHESAQRLFSPDNEALSQARLALTIGVRTALRSTLALVGVSAPDALT